MMNGLWPAALVGILFGCAAFLAIGAGDALCSRIAPFEDGPEPGTPPTPWLIAGAALIGALLALHGTALPQLAIAAIVVASLAACWYSDVRAGIVPDYFTLIPLGTLLMVAAVSRDWPTIVSAIAIALPFGMAATMSKGRGMGWGDVKLVALGGAAVGLGAAALAFSAACVVAVGVAFVRKRARDPIAFAPYLAGATALALAMRAF